MIELIYGFNLERDGDFYIQVANEAMAGLARAAAPGAFLVDSFPFCI